MEVVMEIQRDSYLKQLIAYAGETDPCIPWEALVDWHSRASDPGSRAVYLLPVRSHGGPPEIDDAYRKLVDWVERGVHPGVVQMRMPDGSMRRLAPVEKDFPAEMKGPEMKGSIR